MCVFAGRVNISGFLFSTPLTAVSFRKHPENVKDIPLFYASLGERYDMHVDATHIRHF